MGVSRRRLRVGTTTPGGEAPAAPDLVARNFTRRGPNQLWFADITYVPTWQGWLYLAAVVDACSRYCVGWSMRDDLCGRSRLRRPGDGGDPAPAGRRASSTTRTVSM